MIKKCDDFQNILLQSFIIFQMIIEEHNLRKKSKISINHFTLGIERDSIFWYLHLYWSNYYATLNVLFHLCDFHDDVFWIIWLGIWFNKLHIYIPLIIFFILISFSYLRSENCIKIHFLQFAISSNWNRIHCLKSLVFCCDIRIKYDECFVLAFIFAKLSLIQLL
jgi:hypothetical protein